MIEPRSSNVHWRKSSHSGSQSNCIEVARIADQIFVRDSKQPDGAFLAVSSRAWAEFLCVAEMMVPVLGRGTTP
jgi:hypothetical protein